MDRSKSAGVIQQFLLVAGVLIVLVAGSFYLISRFRDAPIDAPTPEVIVAPEDNNRESPAVAPDEESPEQSQAPAQEPQASETPAQAPAEQFSQTGPAENAVSLLVVATLTVAVVAYVRSRRVLQS